MRIFSPLHILLCPLLHNFEYIFHTELFLNHRYGWTEYDIYYDVSSDNHLHQINTIVTYIYN